MWHPDENRSISRLTSRVVGHDAAAEELDEENGGYCGRDEVVIELFLTLA